MLLARGFELSEIAQFVESFARSSAPSIDAFLARCADHRPRFVEIGKLAIASRIIIKEHPDTLYSPQAMDDSWFAWVFEPRRSASDTCSEMPIRFWTW